MEIGSVRLHRPHVGARNISRSGESHPGGEPCDSRNADCERPPRRCADQCGGSARRTGYERRLYVSSRGETFCGEHWAIVKRYETHGYPKEDTYDGTGVVIKCRSRVTVRESGGNRNRATV